MHPRLTATAAFCREVALPASVLAWVAAFGPAGVDITGATSFVEPVEPTLAADATLTVQPPAIAFGTADVVAASISLMEEPIEAPLSHEPDPIVTAALTNSSETPLAETPPKQADENNTASLELFRHQPSRSLNRSDRRVFSRRRLRRSLSLAALPTRPQGRRHQERRTKKGHRQKKRPAR